MNQTDRPAIGESDRQAMDEWHAARDPATRKRALGLLGGEIDAILRPLGFEGDGVRWHRTGRFATTFVEIQKSRYGNACYINLGRDRRDLDWREPSRRRDTHWRIGSFAASDADSSRLDQLRYGDLGDASPLRDEIVALLRHEAVPFLQQAQGLFGPLVRPRRQVEDEFRRFRRDPGTIFQRLMHALFFGPDGKRPAARSYWICAILWLPLLIYLVALQAAWLAGCRSDAPSACPLLGWDIGPAVRALAAFGWEGIVVIQCALVLAVLGTEFGLRRARRR